jgi:RNA polymerase sigma factor (sigma-70 family)
MPVHLTHHLTAKRRPERDGDLERIVRAAAGGDGAAWEALVRRFSARVRLVTRRHRLTGADAEDVFQTTWLRLFEHISRMHEPLAVGAWLETTARRECVRSLQSAKRTEPTDEQLCDEAAPPVEHHVVSVNERAALSAAIERLSERHRELATLLFMDAEPSYAEIATGLGIPVGSIGPTRGRILARLRADRELIAAISE